MSKIFQFAKCFSCFRSKPCKRSSAWEEATNTESPSETSRRVFHNASPASIAIRSRWITPYPFVKSTTLHSPSAVNTLNQAPAFTNSSPTMKSSLRADSSLHTWWKFTTPLLLDTWIDGNFVSFNCFRCETCLDGKNVTSLRADERGHLVVFLLFGRVHPASRRDV